MDFLIAERLYLPFSLLALSASHEIKRHSSRRSHYSLPLQRGNLRIGKRTFFFGAMLPTNTRFYHRSSRYALNYSTLRHGALYPLCIVSDD